MASYPELEKFAVDEDLETTSETGSSKEEHDRKDKQSKDGQKYLCAPMVLFRVKGGSLWPLAIQLTTKPAANPVIYTPRDNAGQYSNWQVAKLWVRVAESNLHHFIRIFNVHLLLEPVAMAIARNLPAVHPVNKLLYPYIQDLMTVNTIYRKSVLPEDGLLAEVMALGSNGVDFLTQQTAEFRSFSSLNPNEIFAENGTLDRKHLTSYYYRDDCLALWDAIRDFVIDIVCLHYDDDVCVEGDIELESLLRDLHRNGFHGGVDLPKRFSSTEELVLFCSTVIYQATVQYTAFSRGMIDAYGFCLNAPPCLMRSPPLVQETDGYTAEYIHSLLPPGDLYESYIDALLIMTYGFKEPKVRWQR